MSALLLATVVAVLAALLVFGAASAVAQEPDVTFTAEGPSTAHPGETVTYRLYYTVEGAPSASADVVLNWVPGKITYLSTKVVSGEVGLCYEPPVGATKGLVRCSLHPPRGTLETTFQVPLDVTSGKITFGGSEPGSAVPGLRPLASSNRVTTVITPVAPPDTGSGSLASGGQAIPLWAVVLLVAGAIGLVAAAGTLVPRRSR